MEFIDYIIKQPFSTQISVVALLVAFLSLLNSIKISNSNTALSRAMKKTDIGLKLAETGILFEKLIARLKEMNPSADICREEVDGLIHDMTQTIDLCESQQELINKLPFIVGPAKLEELSRNAKILHMKSETLLPRVNKIVEECRNSCSTCKLQFDILHNDKRAERFSFLRNENKIGP